ncbi:MAG: hydroxymethylglutaryl-CoA lyase, partial [Candidatus Latescibacterota bacterium]
MLPETATICEVGLRDGFQSEDRIAPTDLKVEMLNALADAGLREIQAVSFVHPGWVPQMADAEDVWRRIDRRDDVVFSGLVLNRKGLERAREAGVKVVDLSISTSEAHSRANANMSLAEARRQMLDMIELCHANSMTPRAGLQCVFGCANGEKTPVDRVVEMAAEMAGAGAESVSLADSTGVANPVQIKEVIAAVQQAIGSLPIVMHLHNTRGLGLANVVAALEMGVTRFDASIGGMGGCPFIAGATGNIATEDTVYLLHSMGVATGIDLAGVSKVTEMAEAFFDEAFPG